MPNIPYVSLSNIYRELLYFEFEDSEQQLGVCALTSKILTIEDNLDRLAEYVNQKSQGWPNSTWKAFHTFIAYLEEIRYK